LRISFITEARDPRPPRQDRCPGAPGRITTPSSAGRRLPRWDSIDTRSTGRRARRSHSGWWR